MEFYTILTNIGKAKLANAQVTGKTVNLVEIAVGDGNGDYYEPTESQEELVNEVWRGNLNRIAGSEENPNWIILEAVIPTTDGGFTIREVGVFDDDGDMIAIGNYPETYKPQLSEGAGKDLYVRMILEVSNASSVTLKINPAVVLASRAYVDALFEKVATWFVGDMEPDIKLPMQVWVDTHDGLIKQRNLENTGWIVRTPISGSWGVPVGTIITLAGLPAHLPGWVHLTGTILLRADYPLLWEFALNSNNIVTDEEWFSQKRYYSFSYGDGETTFRIPRIYDFVRGYDPASGVPMGQWVEDTFATHGHDVLGASTEGDAVHFGSNRNKAFCGHSGGDLIYYTNNNDGVPYIQPTGGSETAPKHGLLPKLIYTGEVW